MKVKAELIFEISQELIEDLRNNWGLGLDSFLHDELDIAINYKIRLDTNNKDGSPRYKLIGIRVGNCASGELRDENII